MRLGAVVLAALLALGCGRPDPVAQLAACQDGPCARAAVQSAWDADPDACWALVTGTTDELVRAALVAAIAAERPGALEGRCDALPRGGSQERCTRLTRRPHLSRQHKGVARPTKPVQRQAPGPASGALPLPATPRVVTPQDCRGLPDSECAFIGAERAILAHGLPALEESLGLCARSEHGPDCVEHVLELAIPGVPPADAVGPQDLEAATAAVARFRQAAGSDDVAALYEGWFWSVWTTTAFARAENLRGELLEALPATARPHVRFALVWRLLQDDPVTSGFDLATLTARAEALLAQHQPLPEVGGSLAPATIVQTRHSWNGSRDGEPSISAAWCMGSTRRAAHPDPALDLRLAVLEALARQPMAPPAQEFLALAGSEELEILRWTGARLGEVLEPPAARALGEVLAQTETPLVLGRLTKRAGKGDD